MLRWLYNLVTPAPTARFAIGQTANSSKLLHPGVVVDYRLQQVRYGRRWNEETRGWMYQLGDFGGPWFNEEFLTPVRLSADGLVWEPDLPDAELEQIKAEIRAEFGDRSYVARV